VQASGPDARVMPTLEVIMTSATMRHYGAAGRHAEGRGLGLVIFSGVLVAVIGFFNLLDGIAAIANSAFFVGGARFVVGDLRAWGWGWPSSAACSCWRRSGCGQVTSWPAGSQSPWSR
jgi:hypothetical protein